MLIVDGAVVVVGGGAAGSVAVGQPPLLLRPQTVLKTGFGGDDDGDEWPTCEPGASGIGKVETSCIVSLCSNYMIYYYSPTTDRIVSRLSTNGSETTVGRYHCDSVSQSDSITLIK